MPSIIKLLVDDNGYNAKIKSAASMFLNFATKVAGAKGQFSGLTKAIQSSTIAQKAFNAVMKKNPAGLAATLATAAIEKLTEKLAKAAEEQQKIAEASQARAEREKQDNEKITNSIADVITQYEMLRQKWASLSDEQSKISWIQENSNQFKQLGMSIGDVKTAEDVFVNNTQAVCNALIARARAEAYGELYKEKLKEKIKNDLNPSVDNGRLYRKQNRFKRSGNERIAGVSDSDINWRYTNSTDESGNIVNIPMFASYKQSGLDKLNAFAQNMARGKKGIEDNELRMLAMNMSLSQANASSIFNDLGIAYRGKTSGSSKSEKIKKLLPQLALSPDDIANGMAGASLIADPTKIGKGLSNLPQILSPLQQLNEEMERTQNLMMLAPDSDVYTTLKEHLDELIQKEKEFKKENFDKQGKDASVSWSNASHAISAVGSALTTIEDPATKVIGLIAQAVASVAAGFADSMAKDQSSKSNIWAFIASAAAATTAMVATIATIHSVTGYAQGGVIPGNSFSGDNQLARVNAGETILTRADAGVLASQLNDVGLRNLQLTASIHAEQLRLTLNNNGRRTGRGEYVTTNFRA